jgi:hypothetical protein
MLAPRLIKIDIEGAEMFALRGMHETLDRSRNVAIISECIPSFLKDAGFSVEAFLSTFAEQGFKVEVIAKANGAADDADTNPIKILRQCEHGCGKT